MKKYWSRPLAVCGVLVLLGGLVACGGKPEAQDPQLPLLQSALEEGRPPVEVRADHVQMTMRSPEPPMAAEATVPNDDAQIEMLVSTALGKDSDLSGMKIDVDSQDGVVTLRGRAPDPEARERASQLVQGIRKVKAVANQLTLG